MSTQTEYEKLSDWRQIEPGQCSLCGYKLSRPKTVSEFCDYWRMSESKFYSMKRRGHGPVVLKVGGVLLITRQAEDEWCKTLSSAANSTQL